MASASGPLLPGSFTFHKIDYAINTDVQVGSILKCDLQMITTSYPMHGAVMERTYSYVDLDERRKLVTNRHRCE